MISDSLVPGGSALAFDRYAYVLNSPLSYTDPSGHDPSCTLLLDDQCVKWSDNRQAGGVKPKNPKLPKPPPTNPSEDEMIAYIQSFGIVLEGNWTGALLTNLWKALFTHIGYKNLVFWLNGKTVTLIWAGSRTCPAGMDGCYGGLTSGTTVTFSATNMVNPVINILHEFGHLVDNLWGDYFTKRLENQTFTLGDNVYGWNGTSYTSLPSSDNPNDVRYSALKSHRVGGGDAWQQRGGTPHFEDWADIFSNAVIGNIDLTTDLGGQMNNFFSAMQSHVMGGVP